LMIEGQIYRCQNPLCRCEMKVIKASAAVALQNPRCWCGGKMKKPYTPPVLHEMPAKTRVLAGAGTDKH
jgi:hypothetical protein